MKKPFFAQRIGGIPTVFKREDENTNFQKSQHQTMKEAKEIAARLNMLHEFK